MSSEYKVGDRVKVTIEGEVSAIDRGRVRIAGNMGLPRSFAWVSHEQIERVVETFKAGDRVRSKAYPCWEYTLGVDGYYSHPVDRWRNEATAFTSDDYELVYRSPEATP